MITVTDRSVSYLILHIFVAHVIVISPYSDYLLCTGVMHSRLIKIVGLIYFYIFSLMVKTKSMNKKMF